MDFKQDLLSAYRELKTVTVIHEPRTPRYRRAGRRLKALCHTSKAVGSKKLKTRLEKEAETKEAFSVDFYEVAFFLKSESEQCGEYIVCEMAYDQKDILEVDLFCYYDGTDNSKCISSLESAKFFAKKKGYTII